MLAIDGPSFIKNARGAVPGTILSFSDLYHSPGYTIYLRLIVSLSGSIERAIAVSKILSLLMYFATGAMLAALSRKWFGSTVACVACAIFALSSSWRAYSNMIQYEVLAGFLALLFVTLLLSRKSIGAGFVSPF